MKPKYMLLSGAMIFLCSTGGMAECTYKQAQTKMIQFNNIIQETNQKVAEFYAAGKTVPLELTDKVEEMFEASVPLTRKLAAVAESTSKTNQLQDSTQVDEQICRQYDELIKKYKPSFNESENAIGDLKNTKCNSGDLWTRYSAAVQEVTGLFQQGRINEKVVSEFRVLDVQIGSYATTDLPKACRLLDEYEAKLGKIK